MGGGTCGACVRMAISSPVMAGSLPLASAPLGFVAPGSAANTAPSAPREKARSSDEMFFIRWQFRLIPSEPANPPLPLSGQLLAGTLSHPPRFTPYAQQEWVSPSQILAGRKKAARAS